MYEEMQEYYKPIDVDKISASIRDIFRFILRFDEEFAESENDGNWFEIEYQNNKIVIKKCSKSYSIEQGDFNDPINYDYFSHKIVEISASAEEFINILINYIENEQFWKEIYGHRRFYSLHFIPCLNARTYTH